MLCSQMSLKSMKLINMFMWKNTNKSYVIVCLYVDNMLVLGNNDYMIKYSKKILTNKFDKKDLGIAIFILSIKILRHLMNWYCPNLIMLRKLLINLPKVTIT
jgi:hypothetical protein